MYIYVDVEIVVVCIVVFIVIYFKKTTLAHSEFLI